MENHHFHVGAHYDWPCSMMFNGYFDITKGLCPRFHIKPPHNFKDATSSPRKRTTAFLTSFILGAGNLSNFACMSGWSPMDNHFVI